jgi:hypothetical protein
MPNMLAWAVLSHIVNHQLCFLLFDLVTVTGLSGTLVVMLEAAVMRTIYILIDEVFSLVCQVYILLRIH